MKKIILISLAISFCIALPSCKKDEQPVDQAQNKSDDQKADEQKPDQKPDEAKNDVEQKAEVPKDDGSKVEEETKVVDEKPAPCDENTDMKSLKLSAPDDYHCEMGVVRCKNFKGCDCYGNTCQFGSQCLGESGTCACGDVIIRKSDNEKVTGFNCEFVPMATDLIMQCRNREEGCRCGDVTCAVGMGCDLENSKCICDGIKLDITNLMDYSCIDEDETSKKQLLMCEKTEGCDCKGNMIKQYEMCK